MKNHFFVRLAVTFVTMHVFVLASIAGSNTFEKPDFNFPKEVEANAYTALNKALKEGNQHDAALAAMQISEARGQISKHNVTGAFALIDSVIKVGKLSPDYRALLYYYKSERVKNLNPFSSSLGDDQNEDISLWGGEKIDSVSEAWLRQSLDPLGNGDISSLLHPTTDYKNILDPGNDWGKRCMPYLYDFLTDKLWDQIMTGKYRRKAFDQIDSAEEERNNLLEHWLNVHAHDKDLYPTIYLDYRRFVYSNDQSKKWKELNEKYKGHEELGLLYYLTWRKSDRELHYNDYKQYLSDFPKSPLKAYIENMLNIWDIATVEMDFKEIYNTQQDINVKIDFKDNNAHDCKVMLYRVPDKHIDNKKIKISQLDLIDEIIVTNDTINKDSVQATFSPQPYGVYILQTAMRNSNGKWVCKDALEWDAVNHAICVSDIRTFTIAKDNILEVYAVNAITGEPIPDVTVTQIDRDSHKMSEGKTDQDGKYVFTANNDIRSFDYKLSIGDDKYLSNEIQREYHPEYVNKLYNTKESYTAQIFTDLAIYRPGEKVNVSVLLYRSTPTKRNLIDKEHTWKLSLVDADWKVIEDVELKNNSWGQLTHQFTLPSDRMNGNYSIVLTSAIKLGYNLTRRHNIVVSEYKVPTFYVDLSDTKEKQQAGQPVTILGKVQTFSGLPLANQSIKCKVETSHYWFWYSTIDTHTFTAMTDDNGRFLYECPTEWFKDLDQRQAYRIRVQAECTDDAGETQSANKTLRWGKSHRISLSEKDILVPSNGALQLPILFESTESDGTDATCHYTLIDPENKEVIKQGDFSARKALVQWSDVPSGRYNLKATVDGEDDENGFDKEIILYHTSDQMPPRGVNGLWLPKTMQEATRDGKARIRLGSHKPFNIYYIARDRTQITGQGWLHYEAGMHWLELPMAMYKDNQLEVRLFSCLDGQIFSKDITLKSPLRDNVKLQTVTFRDKVAPGSKQHFTLRLVDDEGKPAVGHMIFELYSKAIEQLRSNEWSCAPHYQGLTLYRSNIKQQGYTRYYETQYPLNGVKIKNLSINWPNFSFPINDLFDNVLYEVASSAKPKKRSASKLQGMVGGYHSTSGTRAMENSIEAKEETVMMCNVASAPEFADNTQASEEFDDIALRTEQTHVAAWLPSLTSDKDGYYQIEFDMPADNTTWCLQALAYTQTLATDILRTEILAQRPVMVQPSLPRFLRSGDKTALFANVRNASDSALQVSVLIELFDPRTDKVLQSRTCRLTLAAHGTEAVSIDCQAPTTEPYIGFRIKAKDAEGNGDGEQQLIPVLPSTSPVTEGQPFFLASTNQSVTIDLRRPEGITAHSVLTACSNPTWYCIEALPTIANTDLVTSTGLAHKLFALAVAATLVDSVPALPLVSQLRLDRDLKIGSLQASPWTSAADYQEERMAALSRLTDPTLNEADYQKLYRQLLALQHEDGGFGWFDSQYLRESSFWATSVVVELLGELRYIGCRPKDAQLDSMLVHALQYLDKEVLEFLKEEKEDLNWFKKVNYLNFIGYVYNCSLFDKDRPYASAAIKLRTDNLRRKVLDAIEKQWREFSLSNRAYCAIILHRYGRHDKAERILESLNQLAINDAKRGMYWDQLSDNLWSHPVAHTSVILEAFHEVAPQTYAQQIERVRQWLLLEKQTSDWGNSSLAADAVYALLRTGEDWLHAPLDTVPDMQISIDGRPVEFTPDNLLLGNMRMDLPANARQVTITHRPGHPSWGALIHQYEAPMQQIKQRGVDELSIRKELWAQQADGKWTQLKLNGNAPLQLQKGQRIQVRLVVTCSKALEYLTLTDERPAYLEPVDQLSHYGWEDCIYYQETKDSQTNFFIRRLSKGAHVLTYDCYVTNTGSFSVGIATIQSQYAPQFVAHSDGAKQVIK